MKNKTQIFNDYSEFLEREDRTINGVSPEFAKNNTKYRSDNHTNTGCWNCSNCSYCCSCSYCRSCRYCSSCSYSSYSSYCSSCSYSRNCSSCSSCSYCRYCRSCSSCSYCSGYYDVRECDAQSACFVGLYEYTCSPRIKGGVQMVQMGCYIRTREEWEKDFWNNDSEFPEGSAQGEKRMLAFKIACQWLDLQLTQ